MVICSPFRIKRNVTTVATEWPNNGSYSCSVVVKKMIAKGCVFDDELFTDYTNISRTTLDDAAFPRDEGNKEEVKKCYIS